MLEPLMNAENSFLAALCPIQWMGPFSSSVEHQRKFLRDLPRVILMYSTG